MVKEEKENVNNKNNESRAPSNRKHLRTAWIPFQAGCLTIGLAGMAILIGLLLDTRFDTAPQWTLILLIASAPFALGGVFFLTRRALRKMREEIKTSEPDVNE